MIKSFINYPGGKYRLMEQLLPFFPNHANRMIDLFAGSGVVTSNYNNADEYLVNDINSQLISLLRYIRDVSVDKVEEKMKQIIKSYQLTDTSKNGYDYYGVNSNKGLASLNKEGFLNLRKKYNEIDNEEEKNIILYALIVYGFNNQIRFNRYGKFNNPVGKRDFNDKMKEKLHIFSQNWKEKKPKIISKDFADIALKSSDFIYADPPYLITTAVYNENGGWTSQDDKRLMDYLDYVNTIGAKFALSNVFIHKQQINRPLIEWSRQYHVIDMESSYFNSNYHATRGSSKEVLVINYKK
ncbi:DNA adenine methylase [Limosilactobacillus sp. RRLNB_1_1]|uniref:Site-specific DNA-methyltransferase (adenine-specific) n=1 Tax=Limosilactobacillus albertensis TaxID=2759752 RepID=A0A7W3TRZ0_9LACO|nr:DNA adenine methylase [Limosilactobacillus albertensis]MBB1069804.1 DNA adenine methylase [Limosilactobacillus albertensis]MCD7117682.1 DNA adenine methylase [Limosilactobacillus albertensis]MCD7129605.1 DNA adenine methylase [Limosilactobacillus albertensis]